MVKVSDLSLLQPSVGCRAGSKKSAIFLAVLFFHILFLLYLLFGVLEPNASGYASGLYRRVLYYWPNRFIMCAVQQPSVFSNYTISNVYFKNSAKNEMVANRNSFEELIRSVGIVHGKELSNLKKPLNVQLQVIVNQNSKISYARFLKSSNFSQIDSAILQQIMGSDNYFIVDHRRKIENNSLWKMTELFPLEKYRIDCPESVHTGERE